MEKILIDKGIKIPKEGESRIRYPFKMMKNGDSFFIQESDGKGTRKLRARISSAALRYKRKKYCKFTIRTVTENEIRGVRCWMKDR
jgi:hypothetical protein